MTEIGDSALEVHRARKFIWRDGGRAYRIVVDGKRRGRVRRGKLLRIELPPGKYKVQAKIDWAGSRVVRVVLAEGQTAHLQVAPGGGAAGAVAATFSSNVKTGYLWLFPVDAPPAD